MGHPGRPSTITSTGTSVESDSTRLGHDVSSESVKPEGCQIIKLQCYRSIDARHLCCRIECRVDDSLVVYVPRTIAQAGHMLLSFLCTASRLDC